MTGPTTRRDALRLGAVAGAGVLAGCLGVVGGDGSREGDGPPVASSSLHVPYSFERLRESAVSGGVGREDVPSVDDPRFVDADGADEFLEGWTPVFGVVHRGDAVAYPQPVLVWHEVVNDVVGGDPVTAMAFRRGGTTFGVSGDLVNSNLVLYDRATESRWPQMLATAMDGPFEGESLHEIPVTWTAWRDWKAYHPDTRVLSTDTGFARDYGRDPYGAYGPGPRRGYYAGDHTAFPPLSTNYRLQLKTVVVGVRTGDGAAIVSMKTARVTRHLRLDDFLETLFVYDQRLDAAYAYHDPDGVDVGTDGAEVTVDGETYAPDELPLDRRICVRGMWFAHVGFYPFATVRV